MCWNHPGKFCLKTCINPVSVSQYDKFLGLIPAECCKGCNHPLVCRSWAASAAAADRGRTRCKRAAAGATDLHALLEQAADVQREHAVPHAAAGSLPAAASTPAHHAAAPVHDADRPLLPAGVAPVSVLHDAPAAVIADAFKLDPSSRVMFILLITTYYRNFFLNPRLYKCVSRITKQCGRYAHSVPSTIFFII